MVLASLVWSGLVSYGMELFGPFQGSFKILSSLEWYCKVMESLKWSFMVWMVLCGLVWFGIV